MNIQQRFLFLFILLTSLGLRWCFTNDIGILGKLIFIVSATTVAALAIKRINPQKLEDTSDIAVLITGCDSGFGFEAAQRLVLDGLFVIAGVLDLNSENAHYLKSIFAETQGILVRLDVTSDEEVEKALKTIESVLENKQKKLWALVNNAGIAELGLVESLTIDQYRSVYEVNTIGTIRMTKAFLPLLRWGGRIINITSLASRHSFPVYSAYSASKFATLAFSEALRKEMISFNVKVITIEPTLYKTALTTVATSESKSIMNLSSYPDNVKKIYGEEYLVLLMERVRNSMNDARTSIHEVIDSIEEAVLSVNPSFHYVPGTVPAIRNFMLQLIPEPIKDRIICSRILPNIKPACSL